MTSAVDLCNIALGQIASNRSGNIITGINPPMPPNNAGAQTASMLYQIQADAVFRAAHWNAARLQVPLTLLKAAQGTVENPTGTLPIPPIPWMYEYAYPNDCLLMRFLMPQPRGLQPAGAPLMTNLGVLNRPRQITTLPFVPAVDTDSNGVQIKVILTNAQLAQGVYTGRIDNVDLWDASLKNAVIGTLAAWFCLPVTGDKAMMSMRTQLAVGLIQAARISDGNEGITSSDQKVDWMEVRNSGAGWGDGFALDGPFMAGWQAIGMPDGVSY